MQSWSCYFGLGLTLLVLVVGMSSGVLVNEEEQVSTSNSVATGVLVISYTDVVAVELSRYHVVGFITGRQLTANFQHSVRCFRNMYFWVPRI